MKKKNNAVKTVSYIMVITLVGKVMGLLRSTLIADSYGMGMEANAFNTASLIPNLFFDAIFASAVTVSFIPIFNEYLDREGQEAAFRFSDNFITVFGFFTMLLTLLGILFAAPLTHLFAVGFDAKTAALCTNLLKILFPTVVYTGVAYSFVGILQSLDEFGIPAAMSMVSNGIIIFYLLFFNEKFGVYGLAAAFAAGWMMQAVMQVPSLLKKGYRYHFRFSLKNEGMKKVGLLMLPVMVSTWVQPINIAVNARFASQLFEGDGVSAINYANMLYTIIVGVFVLSVTNVIFPKMSRLSVGREKEEFHAVINQTLRVISFFLLPMMIGLMCLSKPIVALVYERGQFDAFSTAITAKALFFFSLGMMGYGIQAVLSKAFFADHDGKTPLVAGAVSIAANILLCFLLIGPMDVGGLALASAISSIVNAAALFIPMKKKNRKMADKAFLTDFLKMCVAVVVMAVSVLMVQGILYKMLPQGFIGRAIGIAIPAGCGVLIYMTAAFFLRVPEAVFVFQFAKKLCERKK